ncbi:MAG: class I SAM-dependent methyltransferase [Gammaproteobacteria bacterium]|nr:class I SAM-dependent methyltransferase [Gammaproteobacteria bacterium]
MTVPSKPSFPPTDPRFYGEDYYTNDLHDRHWFRNNPSKFRLRWESVLARLQLQPDDVLLELGCASGEHTVQLAPRVRRAIGLDFSPDAIRLARGQAARQSSKAEFVQGNVADLSAFTDGSVTKVLAMDLVEHIPDAVLRSMLSETWRVLAPGGRLVIYTPSATHYVERLKAANFLLRQLPGHIAVREGPAYRELLETQAWASIELGYLPSSYPVFGWIDRLLMALPAIGPLFRFRILATATKP